MVYKFSLRCSSFLDTLSLGASLGSSLFPYVSLSFSRDEFIVRSCDGGLFLRKSLHLDDALDLDAPISFLLDASSLLSSLPSLRSELLSFVYDDESYSLVIIHSRGRIVIPTLDVREMPTFDFGHSVSSLSFRISRSFLLDVCKVGRKFIGNESFRPSLMGIYFVLDGGVLSTCATNGRRLHLSRYVDSSYDGLSHCDFILPSRSLSTIVKLFSSSSLDVDMLDVEVTKDSISFSCPSLRLVSRLLDERYPMFERIIPSSYSYRGHFSASDFSSSLSRMSMFAPSSNVGKLDFSSSSHLTMSCDDYDLSRSSSESIDVLDASGSGVDSCIGFDIPTLLDCVSSLHSSSFYLDVVDANKPLVLREVSDDANITRMFLMTPSILIS